MIDLKNHIRDIPDFPTAGILFRDITPLLANAAAYADAVARFADAAPANITHIAAIEARGFLFAPAVAVALGVGIVPIRKPGKLPHDTLTREYALEYGTDALAMHADALTAGDRVYLIDDLIATGGTLAAAAALITDTGATLEKITCLIELTELNGRQNLPQAPLTALLRY